MFLPICPAQTLAGACRYNAESLVPAPTTAVTCRSICQRGWRNTYSKKAPPYHVTQDGVPIPLQRLEVKRIAGGTNRFEVDVASLRCYKDYPGLGNRSISYPYSSVGNTFTFGVVGKVLKRSG